MHSDPIADLLTRVRNASLAEHESCTMPHSSLKERLANVLKEQEYIKEVSVSGEGVTKSITITLDLDKAGFYTFNRISKPGRRVYTSVKDIKKVKNGLGISIISTPKGLLTNKEARKEKVGGEILCEIW